MSQTISLTTQDLNSISAIVTAAVSASEDRLATAMAQHLARMEVRFDYLKSDVAELKTDVMELRTDVVELKADVFVLKNGVAVLKTDVSVLKTDMREVKWRLSDTIARNEFIALSSGSSASNAKF